VSDADHASAVYVQTGEDELIATELSRGPWDPRAQHGGAPAGLIGWALDPHPDSAGQLFTRVTLDLLRPVPVGPLRVVAHRTGGRQVGRWEASIVADGNTCVLAHAVSQPLTDTRLPATTPDLPPPFPDGAEPVRIPGMPDELTFHYTAMESRLASGSTTQPGPAAAWLRLRYSLVDTDATSPLMRILAAADFGNGISWELPLTDYTFASADLGVNLLRPARGEWVGVQSRTTIAGEGQGLVRSDLFDAEGLIGTATAGLVIRPLRR
jgi:hypothetical protein